jgi:glycosyltransferase involved in cell wall biosynthesis
MDCSNDRARGPAVTVVIPTYERTRWLGDAIESVLAQTFTDFVLVVSDNASGPETAAVVARYEDARIRYVRLDDHVDLNTHFSLWLARVETPYVFLLPDDDLMYPELLAAAVAVLDASPNVGAVHAQADVIDGEGRLVHAGHDMSGAGGNLVERGEEYIRNTMPSSYRVHASTALLRTEAVRELAYEQADYPATDFGLWLRLAASWDIAFLARPLAAYRVHDGSYTALGADVGPQGYLQGARMIESIRDAKLRFLDEYGDRYPDLRRLRRDAHRAMRRQLVTRTSILTHPERRLSQIVRLLARDVSRDHRLVTDGRAWRLVAGGVLGPRLVRRLKRLRPGRAYPSQQEVRP